MELYIKGNESYYLEDYEMAINYYLYYILYLDNTNLDKSIEKSNIYSNISACYLKLMDYNNSLLYGIKSLELNINNTISWGRVGWSYKALKIHTKAYESFIIANKLNPKNIYYINELKFYSKKMNNIDQKINITNLFSLFKNNSSLFNELKDLKSDIINGINQDKIYDLIENIINNL